MSSNTFPPCPPPLVLAIGQFDGVHLGHQAVFRAALDEAVRLGGTAGCLTFHPHVAQLLNPGAAPDLLATPTQSRERIAACGIDFIRTLPFDRGFAALEPRDFLAFLKREHPALAAIVVGRNFTFGQNRAGTTETLPGLAAERGVAARIVPHVDHGGAPVSSTRIRAAVHAGDMPLARALLGRPFALAGAVVRGRAVGRTLGFPTANIQPTLPIRPAPGIYAARLHLPDGSRPGAAFVPNPADPAQHHFGTVVEIHVPGLDRDLYGQAVEISFTRRIRGHIPFPDSAAAAAQIARDTHEALRMDAEDAP